MNLKLLYISMLIGVSYVKAAEISGDFADDNEVAQVIVLNNSGLDFSSCTLSEIGDKTISVTRNDLKFESSFSLKTEAEQAIKIGTFQELRLRCNSSLDQKAYSLIIPRADYFKVNSLRTFYPEENALVRLIIEGLCTKEGYLCVDASSKHIGTALWYVSPDTKYFKPEASAGARR